MPGWMEHLKRCSVDSRSWEVKSTCSYSLILHFFTSPGRTILINPKATLFSLALFTQIVQPATPMLVQAIYGLALAIVALLWFAIVAVVISQQAFKRHLLSFSHWLERLTGVTLIALGLRLAIAEATD